MYWDWKGFFGNLSIGWGVLTAFAIAVAINNPKPITTEGVMFFVIGYGAWLIESLMAEALASSGFEF